MSDRGPKRPSAIAPCALQVAKKNPLNARARLAQLKVCRDAKDKTATATVSTTPMSATATAQRSDGDD
eukprot:CAMPEP_0204601366 /NCGR_PEP_ID=MMETSP0661-20131031/55986_1 /ASSEMBLY_ACC=CAM_ASM_000606 /TAXON_ID=109239 /ORGANISM="Alexandrium margalefi, Strain AMGDE01CS-322" /LENGTH=67 /DNA_ID=CAMNT_0051612225 /DNA_START=39 /DNA_END=240 /DNA_ORIENTATION=-